MSEQGIGREIGLTIERLKESIGYDPETGAFTWIAVRRGTKPGRKAGAVDPSGYRLIRIDGRLYRACRLAWFYMNGEWPEKQIDHINLDRSDDRWANLRLASNGENGMNKRVRADSTSQLKGANWCSTSQKWYARICVDRKRISLGRFDTALEAHRAYAEASKKLHGQFGRAS